MCLIVTMKKKIVFMKMLGCLGEKYDIVKLQTTITKSVTMERLIKHTDGFVYYGL